MHFHFILLQPTDYVQWGQTPYEFTSLPINNFTTFYYNNKTSLNTCCMYTGFILTQMRLQREFEPIVTWHKPRERTLLHMQDKKVLAIILSKLHISYSSMIMLGFFAFFYAFKFYYKFCDSAEHFWKSIDYVYMFW